MRVKLLKIVFFSLSFLCSITLLAEDASTVHLRILFPSGPSYQRRMEYYIELDNNHIGNLRCSDYIDYKLPVGSKHDLTIYVNDNGFGQFFDISQKKFKRKKMSVQAKEGRDIYVYCADAVARLDTKRGEYLYQSILSSGRAYYTYVVKENDVLGDIAKSHNTSVKDIMNWNNLENTNLNSGQTIVIYGNVREERSPFQKTENSENEIASQNSKNEKISIVDSSIPIAKTNTDNTYVLIIANETYSFLDKVNYATNDGKIFKEYCIKTLGIPENQIFLYENASYGLIADGVSKLNYCLDNFENSKAIVYYCGHGIPDEKTGQAYLIPVDGKGTNMTTCYSLKNLYKTLAATKAQSITYFMDACFTGANKEGSMLVAARGVAREPMKETLAGKTVVFSASSGDETAMTLEEQGHGLFTYYLLKKLQETEGNVTYGELADYINKNVKKDAFLINEKPQTPVVATSPAVQNTWKTMKLK